MSADIALGAACCIGGGLLLLFVGFTLFTVIFNKQWNAFLDRILW